MIKENTFKRYNATFISFIYSSSTIQSSYFTPPNSYNPSFRDLSIVANEMNLILMFENEVDISNFTSLLLIDTVMNLGDKYNYHISLSSNPLIKHIGSRNYEVSYPLLTTKKGNLKRIKLNDFVNFVDVCGNYKTPCKYILKSSKNLSNISINGYAIKNIKKDTLIVLDGILKKATEDGLNKFMDVVLEKNQFPYLDPGVQNIYLSNRELEVFLEYYPIYL